MCCSCCEAYSPEVFYNTIPPHAVFEDYGSAITHAFQCMDDDNFADCFGRDPCFSDMVISWSAIGDVFEEFFRTGNIDANELTTRRRVMMLMKNTFSQIRGFHNIIES